MSDGTYTPREGTIAARVLAHLQGLPAGTKLLTAELAAALGIDASSISASCAPAVEHGTLERTGEGRRMYYAVPEAAEAADPGGPLTITSDSAGDVWFEGATVHENGCVLLNKIQLRQLVKYATTSPFDLEPAAEGAPA